MTKKVLTSFSPFSCSAKDECHFVHWKNFSPLRVKILILLPPLQRLFLFSQNICRKGLFDFLYKALNDYIPSLPPP